MIPIESVRHAHLVWWVNLALGEMEMDSSPTEGCRKKVEETEGCRTGADDLRSGLGEEDTVASVAFEGFVPVAEAVRLSPL